MARDVAAGVLLGLAVLVVLGASFGILLMPDAAARLHFVTPGAVVAPFLVTAAILVYSGLTENSGQTVLALVFLVAGGPFLSHATIRAIRVRETGDWRLEARRSRSPGTGGER
jgi:multisubunit Na+/H+ antiporter MnhG subunit